MILRKVDGRADAMSPNLVNSLVYNDKVVFPKPYGPVDTGKDVFQEFVRGKIGGPLGLTLYFPDGWDAYHVGSGEIHCATNVIRAPLQTNWWNVAF